MGYFKTAEITNTIDPLQQDALATQARAREKESEVQELTLRLQDARNSLRVFLGEYQARVGVHYIRLDKIELQIREYEFRLKMLQGGKGKPGPDLLQKIEKAVAARFAEERANLRRREKETNETAERHKKELRKNEWRTSASPDFVRKVKVIFRKLALRYHPDKATNNNERTEFQQIMAAINAAYAEGDLNLLILQLEKAENEEKIAQETWEEKLERLREEYRKLCGIAKKLKTELKEIMESDAFALKLRVEEARLEGKDLLLELTRKIMAAVRQKKQVLEDLVEEYQAKANEVVHGRL